LALHFTDLPVLHLSPRRKQAEMGAADLSWHSRKQCKKRV